MTPTNADWPALDSDVDHKGQIVVQAGLERGLYTDTHRYKNLHNALLGNAGAVGLSSFNPQVTSFLAKWGALRWLAAWREGSKWAVVTDGSEAALAPVDTDWSRFDLPSFELLPGPRRHLLDVADGAAGDPGTAGSAHEPVGVVPPLVDSTLKGLPVLEPLVRESPMTTTVVHNPVAQSQRHGGLRVACINGNKRLSGSAAPAFVSWVERVDPDLLVVQEACKDGAAPTDLPGYTPLGGTARLRAWAKPALAVERVRELETFCQAVDLAHLVVYSVHLDPYGAMGRADNLYRIQNHAAEESKPVIIVGDFNIAPAPEDGLSNGSPSKGVNTPVDRGALGSLSHAHALVDLHTPGTFTWERQQKNVHSQYRMDLALVHKTLVEATTVTYDHSTRLGEHAFTDHSALVIATVGAIAPNESETIAEPEVQPVLAPPATASVEPEPAPEPASEPAPLPPQEPVASTQETTTPTWSPLTAPTPEPVPAPVEVPSVPPVASGPMLPSEDLPPNSYQPVPQAAIPEPALPPPDWHPDPSGNPFWRYWDGVNWTEWVRYTLDPAETPHQRPV